jgi:hypothetical protein
MWKGGIQIGVTTVIGRSSRHFPCISAKEVFEGTRGCCIAGSGTTRDGLALVQKLFLVSADNPFLVSAVLADTICTIQEMTDFLYRLFRTNTNNLLMVSVVINNRYE